jgi:hypothetical protein
MPQKEKGRPQHLGARPFWILSDAPFAIIALVLGTYARRGRLLVLQLKDFDPNARTIRI